MIREYINYIKDVRGLSEATCYGYEKDLHVFVTWAKRKSLTWRTLTEKDVDAWLASMAEEGMMPRTRNRRLAALRQMLSWAQHKGMLESNAARFCQAAKTGHQLPKTLETGAIEKYLNENAQDSMEAWIKLAISMLYETGMRIGEMMKIKAQDIKKDTRTIHVTGKGNKERRCYYGDHTERWLKECRLNEEKSIFASNSVQTWRMMIKKALQDRTGEMHPHMLRHTFATRLLNNGMDIATVSALMGHRKIETTQIYASVADNRQQAAYRHATGN